MQHLLKTLTCTVSAIALGLTVGLCPDARGQGRQDQDTSSRQKQDLDKRGDRGSEEGTDTPSGALDKALKSFQDYREGTAKGAEQSRKEIDRMVRELTDLVQMRYRMAVALASHRAETQTTSPGPFGSPGAGPVGQPQPEAASPGQRAERGDDQEASIQKQEAICRELEQLQNQLRAEIAQARGQAEQLASQIRMIREQRRSQEGTGAGRRSERSERQERENSRKD
jgi:hypothetical protein